MRSMGGRHDGVGIVEAAYRDAETDQGWLAGIVEAAEPAASEGLGVLAYTYNASRAPVRVADVADRDLALPREVLLGAVESVDDDYIANTWRRLSFGLGSQHIPFDELPAAAGLVAHGVHDMLAVNAYDPSGEGVWLGAPLPVQRKPRPGEHYMWTRIAAHVAAARRLRRLGRTARSPEQAAAVMTPSGKVEHAVPSSHAIRGELVDAVERLECARGKLRRNDPISALDNWRALVAARFSLVDHFESGGRRYIIAVENSPLDLGPEVLTARERQVVAAIAGGRTTKLIAYELGLSDSTVRVLLTRAMRKLRVRTRGELVALFIAHRRARADGRGCGA